jgi:SAM-dependent methyltransferase
LAFDAAYYERFYGDPRTRAAGPPEQRRRARFIAAYLRYLEIPVERILDVGCGLGTMLEQLQRAFPKATCTGVEYSDYLCERHGWIRGSVVDYRDAPHDLVVCNDVLAYLDKRSCGRALTNLARLTACALYLGVLTDEDRALCDPERTDMAQRSRPAAWYRARLARHFVSVGGGLFLKKPLAAAVWALERAE